MKLQTSITRIIPAFVLALVLAAGSVAQDMPTPPPVEDNGDARAQYGAAVEEAQAAAAQGTVDGYVAAGDAYVRAAEVAEASGDDELTVNVRAAREAAVRSYVDAGSHYASQSAFADAGAQFLRASELAGLIGDEALQARVTGNAGTAFIQAEDFEQAATLFEQASALNPENLDYAYLHAVAIRGMGDSDAALAAFADVAARAEAAGDAENMRKSNEAAGRMHLATARDAIQAQNWRSAIQALDEAAAFLPEDDANLNTFYANAYYRQGVSQVQAEQWGPARTSLQRAQEYARVAGRDQIVRGAQQQLDYIQQVQG
jgi:tetratricopeptide (TPR) repeat protein